MKLRSIRKWVTVALVLALLPVAYVLAEEGGEGMDLYNKKCAMCHGKDGVAKAIATGSANLNDPEWQEATSVEEIVKVTAAGKGKMKGYEGKFEPDQIKAIATYVKQLK